MFYQKVNLKSKEEMIEFLSKHFRYNTLSYHNKSTSYAHNVKINKVVPLNLRDNAYDIISCDDSMVYDDINSLLRDFAHKHDYSYQIGFNGRSDGYLVLYQGGYEKKVIYKEEDFKNDNGYKGRVYSDKYGWKSLEEAKEEGLLNKEIKKIFTYSGRSLDMQEDFQEWDIGQLRERVKLIQDFDKCCDDVVNLFIDYCKTFEVIEKEIQVTKKIKVLAEK